MYRIKNLEYILQKVLPNICWFHPDSNSKPFPKQRVF